jgi:hypothetical protein
MTKVCGSYGQWYDLDLGNCQTRVIENLAPTLTSVIIFCNISYILELTYTWVLSFPQWNPWPQPSKKGNIKDWSLTVPAIFIIMHTRDGGTLPAQVPGLWVQAWIFPFSGTRCDIPGLTQSTERRVSHVLLYEILFLSELGTIFELPQTWVH